MPRFDVIVSERGFNQSSLVGYGVPEADLGPFLSRIMGTYEEDYGQPNTSKQKRCAVTVHLHPTFWNASKKAWVYDCRTTNTPWRPK